MRSLIGVFRYKDITLQGCSLTEMCPDRCPLLMILPCRVVSFLTEVYSRAWCVVLG